MSEKFKISLEASIFDDFFVFNYIESLSKNDIVFDSVINNPGLLSNQTKWTINSYFWFC